MPHMKTGPFSGQQPGKVTQEEIPKAMHKDTNHDKSTSFRSETNGISERNGPNKKRKEFDSVSLIKI